MSKSLDVLIQARDLLQKKGWTQHVLARRADGSPCSSQATYAASFCAIGAITAVGGDYGARCALADVMGAITAFNDTPGRTKEEVIEKFNEAIRRNEAA